MIFNNLVSVDKVASTGNSKYNRAKNFQFKSLEKGYVTAFTQQKSREYWIKENFARVYFFITKLKLSSKAPTSEHRLSISDLKSQAQITSSDGMATHFDTKIWRRKRWNNEKKWP